MLDGFEGTNSVLGSSIQKLFLCTVHSIGLCFRLCFVVSGPSVSCPPLLHSGLLRSLCVSVVSRGSVRRRSVVRIQALTFNARVRPLNPRIKTCKLVLHRQNHQVRAQKTHILNKASIVRCSDICTNGEARANGDTQRQTGTKTETDIRTDTDKQR